MNLLAHMHLATLANSSIIGNVAADFVKGDPYRQYPTKIADGIMLHRRIDKRTDQLDAVKQAKSLFQPQYQRVAPITLDIVWDHFLSRYWHRYGLKLDLVTFNNNMQHQINPYIDLFGTEFKQFIQHMWQDNWLIRYANLQFIGKVLNGMANRRPKLISLRNTFMDIEQHYDQLAQIFDSFYPLLVHDATFNEL